MKRILLLAWVGLVGTALALQLCLLVSSCSTHGHTSRWNARHPLAPQVQPPDTSKHGDDPDDDGHRR